MENTTKIQRVQCIMNIINTTIFTIGSFLIIKTGFLNYSSIIGAYNMNYLRFDKNAQLKSKLRNTFFGLVPSSQVDIIRNTFMDIKEYMNRSV